MIFMSSASNFECYLMLSFILIDHLQYALARLALLSQVRAKRSPSDKVYSVFYDWNNPHGLTLTLIPLMISASYNQYTTSAYLSDKYLSD